MFILTVVSLIEDTCLDASIMSDINEREKKTPLMYAKNIFSSLNELNNKLNEF